MAIEIKSANMIAYPLFVLLDKYSKMQKKKIKHSIQHFYKCVKFFSRIVQTVNYLKKNTDVLIINDNMI